jgi:predicted enzyme related to lactoylglutathione lyase
VIQVDSIDNTLKNIETLGGKVAIRKESIADMGFYAQFDDPEGNRIGLFQEAK